MRDRMTLQEIADLVGGTLEGGDPLTSVTGVMTIREAGKSHVTFLSNPRYQKDFHATHAAVVLVAEGLDAAGHTVIRCKNPYLAFALVSQAFSPPVPGPEPCTAPGAHVSPQARIGAGVGIMAGATVAEGAEIGDGTLLYAGVYIGHGTRVGRNCRLYPNVTIYHGCRLGDRVIVHAGTVVGSDGYGFATDFETGCHVKIPQSGGVILEDDVEIGAGCSIDRGAIGDTVIGAGTKIDNLVQIGHNVRTGRSCLIVSQTGISGSTTLGDATVVGAQAGIVGHLKIGNRVRIGARSGVSHDIEDGAEVLGSPAVSSGLCKKIWVSWPHLPDMRRRLRALEKK